MAAVLRASLSRGTGMLNAPRMGASSPVLTHLHRAPQKSYMSSPLATRMIRTNNSMIRTRNFSRDVLPRNRRWSNPMISPHNTVLLLITANVGVTMLWSDAQSSRARYYRMVNFFTTSSAHIDRGHYYTLLTCVFSHKDVGHLLTNMVGLYFFGSELCTLLGPKRFLALYLGSGIFSSFAAVAEQKYNQRAQLNLGASGAVNSITALSVLLFPRSTLLLFGIVPMPAWVAGTLFVGRDAYAWASDKQDGIGHFAHLSGALCGGAYYLYLRRVARFL